MKPVLPESYRQFVVCPACKAPLDWSDHSAVCRLCQTTYSSVNGVWSFASQPAVQDSALLAQWKHGQEEYEEWSQTIDDEYTRYLSEIDEVREIYTAVYPLEGAVLDVGGHDGRLRHFLGDTTRYLVIDPFSEAVLRLPDRPNLRRAYPSLEVSCPFVQAVAESLPIADATFDIVHMRSVLDHFADAAGALREAHRVLKEGGRILIGLHVTGGMSSLSHEHGLMGLLARTKKKLRDEGVVRTFGAVLRRLTGRAKHDEHVWHPTYDGLIELVRDAKFTIIGEHWQKPPNDHVIYLMAQKASRQTTGEATT